jgi:WD40 repeat protein
MNYDAFLSYSHGAGGRLAAAIELTLEGLGKRWDERRALTVFRDVSKQGTTADLAADLLARLDASRFFVLLASPEAARSPWVAQEVRHWLETKGLGRLLLALVGGDLVWDAGAGRFDAARTTALPAPLLEAYAAQPKWVDFRWAAGEEGLGPGHERFADCVADLSAAIQGRSKDEIVGRQLREHAKAVARQIAQQASTLVARQPDLALLLAAAATELDSNPDTRRALLGSLEATADLGAILGVGGRVTSFAFEGSGETLLAGTRDGVVEEWDPATGARLREFRPGPNSPVTALAFNLRGSAFAAGFADGVVAVAARDGRVLNAVRAGAPPQLVALDNSAGLVAAAGESAASSLVTVELWRLDPPAHRVPYTEQYATLRHLCFDWQGRLLKVLELGTVVTFDALSGAEVRRRDLPLYPRPGPKSFSPDGRTGVHTSFDGGVVALFDTEAQEPAEQEWLADEFEGVAYGVAVSPGVDCAAVIANRRLKVMPTGGGRPAFECAGMPTGEVKLGLTPGGTAVAVLGDGRAQLHWPGRRSRLGQTLMTEVALPSVMGAVGDAAFSPDGRLLAWVAKPDANLGGEGRPGRTPGQTVAVWDCARGRWATSIASGTAHQLAFDGTRRLVVMNLEGELSSWDVEAGAQAQPLARVPAEAIPGGMARLWCPAGGRAVCITHGSDGEAAVYSVSDTSAVPIWSRPPRGAHVSITATTSRSTRFALCDADGAVEVWDIGGALVYTTKVGDMYSARMAMSGDGRRLAVADAGGIFVHDVDAATVIADVAVGDVADVALSADARSMFVLASDGGITLYDLPDGLIAGTLQGTPGTTWGLLRTGPDARWLAELAAGGALTLWDVGPDSWRALARRVAGRELTEAEKTRFHLDARGPSRP